MVQQTTPLHVRRAYRLYKRYGEQFAEYIIRKAIENGHVFAGFHDTTPNANSGEQWINGVTPPVIPGPESDDHLLEQEIPICRLGPFLQTIVNNGDKAYIDKSMIRALRLIITRREICAKWYRRYTAKGDQPGQESIIRHQHVIDTLHGYLETIKFTWPQHFQPSTTDPACSPTSNSEDLETLLPEFSEFKVSSTPEAESNMLSADDEHSMMSFTREQSTKDESDYNNEVPVENAISWSRACFLRNLARIKDICMQDFIGAATASQSFGVAVIVKESAVRLAIEAEDEASLADHDEVGAALWSEEYFQSLTRTPEGIINEPHLRIHDIIVRALHRRLDPNLARIPATPNLAELTQNTDYFEDNAKANLQLETVYVDRCIVDASKDLIPSNSDTHLTRMLRPLLVGGLDALKSDGVSGALAFAMYLDILFTEVCCKHGITFQDRMIEENGKAQLSPAKNLELITSKDPLYMNVDTQDQDRVMTSTMTAIRSVEVQSKLLQQTFLGGNKRDPRVPISQAFMHHRRVQLEVAVATSETLCRSYVFTFQVHLWNILKQEGKMGKNASWPALESLVGRIGEEVFFQGSAAPSSEQKIEYFNRAVLASGFKMPPRQDRKRRNDEWVWGKKESLPLKSIQTKAWPMATMDANIPTARLYKDVALYLRATSVEQILGNPKQVAMRLDGSLEHTSTLRRLVGNGPELTDPVLLALIRRQAIIEESLRLYNFVELHQACIVIADSIFTLWNSCEWFTVKRSAVADCVKAKFKVYEILLDIAFLIEEDTAGEQFEDKNILRRLGLQMAKLARHLTGLMKQHGEAGIRNIPAQQRESLKSLEGNLMQALKHATRNGGLILDIFTEDQKKGLRGLKKVQVFNTEHEVRQLFGWYKMFPEHQEST